VNDPGSGARLRPSAGGRVVQVSVPHVMSLSSALRGRVQVSLGSGHAACLRVCSTQRCHRSTWSRVRDRQRALRTAQVTCPGRLAAAGTGRHQTEGHSRRRRLASERLSDAVLRALFERRFPPGFAGLDVFAETAPVETIVSREVLSLVRSTCVRREQDGG